MEKELKLLLNELDIDTEDAGVETNLNEIGVDSIVMMQFIVLMKHSKSPSRAGETSRRKWR
jgi:aryl carrier-like protein